MRMKRKRRGELVLQVLMVMLVLAADYVTAKNEYYMDQKQDCNLVGVIDVSRDQTIQIYGRTTDISTSTQSGCTLNFRAADSDANLELDFRSFSMQTCDVSLIVSGDGSGKQSTYSCGDRDPHSYFSVGRSITITLYKSVVTNQDYNFQLSVKATRTNLYPPPSDSNPVAVGLVIGIVGAIFGMIFFISCIGVCCFRKYRARGPTKSPYLYDPNSKVRLDESNSHASIGHTNESMKMGASPMSRKKLLAHSDSSDEKWDSKNRGGPTRTLNFQSNNRSNIPPPPPPPPTVPNMDSNSRPKSGHFTDFREGKRETGNGNIVDIREGRGGTRNASNANERAVDVDSKQNNAVLNALHSNPKFRNSFKESESEADERAKRITSTSSFERFGKAPSPPSSEENISRPSLPPVQKSPKGRRSKQHATINRNPRPASMSSEELAQIERGRLDSDDDPNIRVVHDYSSTSSSSEVVPINVNEQAKKKTNTTHSLKPDRKGPKGRKKTTQSVSSTLDPEPEPDRRDRRDRVGDAGAKQSLKTELDRVASADRDLNDSFVKTSSGRYIKLPRKSPKSSGRGFSHRRGRSADMLDSRSSTPTRGFGSMEDLEIPQLQRASSKSSLYSSRSSLYDRRGRRRKGSYADSVASYRDDRYRDHDDSYSEDDDFDGYEKPLSRRDRDRLYRSDNDLGRSVGRRQKECATQTLRETATQTGENEEVVVNQKRLVNKKRRSKSVSSSGTQTAAKKNEEKKTKTKTATKEVNGKKTKSKPKRSKSLNELDTDEEDVAISAGKPPKPKPKPKPRKSTSALDEIHKSVSLGNLAEENKNISLPQTERFVPEYYPQGYPVGPPQGYPAGPPPGYPGQPGMQVQYPYPVQVVPPGYNPNQYPLPHQQQPVISGNIPQTQPGQRKKSNWELLCEMTEGGHQRDDATETGSVASSVFANTPASVPGYGVQMGNQQFYSQPAFYLPQQQQQYPGYTQQQEGTNTDMNRAQPQMTQQQKGPEVAKVQKQPVKSSWEALKEITGSQGQLSAKPTNEVSAKPTNGNGNSRTESVV